MEKMLLSRPGPITVRLDEPRVTGYRWQLTRCPAQVRLLREESPSPPASGHKLGGSGARIFHLDIGQSGTYDLRFELRRAWEDSPHSTHEVQVVVSD